MTEKEVLEAIENGESAYGLLMKADPKLEKKFHSLCKKIIKYHAEVRKHFPDAEYYTGSGGFNLLLGSSHDDHTTDPQRQLVALNGTGVSIGDGDF